MPCVLSPFSCGLELRWIHSSVGLGLEGRWVWRAVGSGRESPESLPYELCPSCAAPEVVADFSGICVLAFSCCYIRGIEVLTSILNDVATNFLSTLFNLIYLKGTLPL